MKKHFIVFAILLVSASWAQKTKKSDVTNEKSSLSEIFVDNSKDLDIKSKKGESYLPEAGNWAITFNAAPLFEFVGNSFNGETSNGAPELESSFEGNFVGKYFVTNKKAYRVIFNLVTERRKFEVGAPEPELSPAASSPDITFQKFINSNFETTLGIGKEWRRGNTRLQGYYGADVFINLIGGSSEGNETRVDFFGTATNNTKITIESFGKAKSKLGFGFGAQAFVGAEYFVFPKFSIGAQYAYGIEYKKSGKVGGKLSSKTTTVTNNAGLVNTTVNEESLEVSNSFPNSSNFTAEVSVISLNLTLHF